MSFHLFASHEASFVLYFCCVVFPLRLRDNCPSWEISFVNLCYKKYVFFACKSVRHRERDLCVVRGSKIFLLSFFTRALNLTFSLFIFCLDFLFSVSKFF